MKKLQDMTRKKLNELRNKYINSLPYLQNKSLLEREIELINEELELREKRKEIYLNYVKGRKNNGD